MGFNFMISALPMAGVLYSFRISDPVGKGIVILLVLASVAVWTIMIAKHLELLKAEKADQLFNRAFERQANPMEIYLRDLGLYKDSPMAKVYSAACLAVRREFEVQAQKQSRQLEEIDLSRERLSALQVDAIRKVAECAAADQILLLEDQMSMLSTAYTLAPMLGLFGTVWGVMVAFEAMGQQGMANLSAVAPGIASALLTTVIGLVVAIPSAWGSNRLNEKIRFLSVQMENFADKFAARLQQSFLYE
ncbi:MAG: MotA/TolQ/ExbB proton channel family protein [Verrucomicrobiota bacterium]|jgi:biopolymer transport protein ExbB/TolQ|nr:MotA/TolQ/ExbB proton channel family protein [Verrucomicrobiota bacterium]